MNRGKIGQSAIEYLMTYGWMLLAVAITGSAIFSLAGDQCVRGSSGFTGNDIQIEDFGLLSTESSMSLLIGNMREQEVVIQSVELEDVENSTSESIGPGGSEQVSVPGIIGSDSCNTLDVRVEYSISSLDNQYISGEITGPYATDSIPSPTINSVQQ